MVSRAVLLLSADKSGLNAGRLGEETGPYHEIVDLDLQDGSFRRSAT